MLELYICLLSKKYVILIYLDIYMIKVIII